MAGPLKRYKVIQNGYETVMRLNEEDAERLHAEPLDAAPAPKKRAPANKARTAANKAE